MSPCCTGIRAFTPVAATWRPACESIHSAPCVGLGPQLRRSDASANAGWGSDRSACSAEAKRREAGGSTFACSSLMPTPSAALRIRVPRPAARITTLRTRWSAPPPPSCCLRRRSSRSAAAAAAASAHAVPPAPIELE
eukprot:scaffold3531_cov279-Prasinococcus_capsulatus_cf.AAC.2